jgi:16S rRNA (uracil1498-N3)-methyltransferase
MPRFFIGGTNISGGIVVISGSDAEHIKVLRMKLGERLIVCDGSGKDHICRLINIGDHSVRAEIIETQSCPSEPSVRCLILAGMPKGDRADFIVQKCTEAGASDIAFFICERSVSRPDLKGMDKKTARWQRIAEEAAKQAGRGIIPEVAILGSFAEALDAGVKCTLPLFMYETGERTPLKEALEGAGNFESVSIITGPEGGFEKYEADLAKAAGFRLCSMGPRILRCETAPLCALTAVMYHTGNM